MCTPLIIQGHLTSHLHRLTLSPINGEHKSSMSYTKASSYFQMQTYRHIAYLCLFRRTSSMVRVIHLFVFYIDYIAPSMRCLTLFTPTNLLCFQAQDFEDSRIHYLTSYYLPPYSVPYQDLTPDLVDFTS